MILYNSGVNLLPLWGHFGVTLCTRGCVWITSEWLWRYFGYMRLALDHFWATLGLLWDHFGFTLAVAGVPCGFWWAFSTIFGAQKGPWDQVKGCRDAPGRHQVCTKYAPSMHQGDTRRSVGGYFAVIVWLLCAFWDHVLITLSIRGWLWSHFGPFSKNLHFTNGF